MAIGSRDTMNTGQADLMHIPVEQINVAPEPLANHGLSYESSSKGSNTLTNSEDTHIASVDAIEPSLKDMKFHYQPNLYAKDPVPSLEEWEAIWSLWDLVSLKMLPTEELISKPIYLRNCCIFYLGHIPTFLDIHLTKSTKRSPTEPAYFQSIFERGIDPDVDNPEKCHAHSEIPDTWPELEVILKYQQDVRARTARILDDKMLLSEPAVRKALWLGYEHEAMHLETYLYMLLQSDKILPPPGPRPNFESIALQSRANAAAKSWITIPSRSITVGQHDQSKFWTWDNEKPARSQNVASFQVRSLPITNFDFIDYLLDTGSTNVPKSWVFAAPRQQLSSEKPLLNGHADTSFEDFIKDKAIRTVYGLVPLIHALDWPVMGSYDELAECARHLGGRIPSLGESKSVRITAEEAKPVQVAAGLNSESELFADLTNENVALKHFHPVPVTDDKSTTGGIAPMGGVWEWTSTVLEKWNGFEAMPEYPGYTADFFDEKHNIVLGGSWATLPRIAGRRSFINWYQRNYPYAWVGARVVRDLPIVNATNGN